MAFIPECQTAEDPLLEENKALSALLNKYRVELQHLKEENQRLTSEVGKQKFGTDSLQRSKMKDSKIKHFTGLPNFLVFLWFVNFVQDCVPSVYGIRVSDQILAVLMKLKLNLTNEFLAHLFHIPKQRISDILKCNLPKFSNRLAAFIHWPSREAVRKHMPKSFRELGFNSVRVIIDCTEVFIQRPRQLYLRAQTWSNYKHHNTVKFLIGITPAGAICFLSKAWGGRASDKHITQNSGFYDNLEFGDKVLADRGFTIAEEVANHHASLAIPAFTKSKVQSSGRDVELTRKLARVRIHVERAIRRWKVFKILSTTMPITLLPYVDNIAFICAAIVNLNDKIIQKK